MSLDNNMQQYNQNKVGGTDELNVTDIEVVNNNAINTNDQVHDEPNDEQVLSDIEEINNDDTLNQEPNPNMDEKNDEPIPDADGQNNNDADGDDNNDEEDGQDNNNTGSENDSNKKSDNNDENNVTKQVQRQKRGLPKKMLVNQQKYMEAIEKQQRMINNNKDKKKAKAIAIKKSKNKITDGNKKLPPEPGMKRIMVGGKIMYIPNKPKNTDINNNIIPSSPEPIKNDDKNRNSSPLPQPVKKNTLEKTPEAKPEIMVQDNDLVEPIEQPKRIPSAIAKKMEKYAEQIARQNSSATRRNKFAMGNKSGKKIPSKYAKEIEKDVKKQTVKNVKNFSDLRRIKALENIAPNTDIDANKASITELRKLRVEQRKREQADHKKRAEANKKENAVQEILKNDKMSKFAKTVAIKNLSINSRHRRINPLQKEN